MIFIAVSLVIFSMKCVFQEVLVSKRDELRSKHEDAKQLKEGIDRRRRLVDTFLRKQLTHDQFEDYEYFIRMKAKLTMDKQEIEDKITLGNEQLKALKQTSN